LDVGDILTGVGAWLAARATHTKVLLGLATSVLVVELTLRSFARRSRAYALWTRGVEAVGVVWTALILSIVYLLSVGPVSVFMRLFADDPLDRRLAPEASFWRPHEPNPLGPERAARHQF
jgi:hypothetical protein